MKISLKSNWKARIPGKVMVYLSNNKDKEFVDETFDELYKSSQMS